MICIDASNPLVGFVLFAVVVFSLINFGFAVGLLRRKEQINMSLIDDVRSYFYPGSEDIAALREEVERLLADRDLWREKAERNGTLATRYQDALLEITQAYGSANAASVMAAIADKAVRLTVSGS